MTTNSPDISVLEAKVLIDLSIPVPAITFINQSTGAHLVNVSYIFEVYNPSNETVYLGNFSTPDVTGVWTTFSPSLTIPTFQKHVEWSGASPYRIVIRARDQAGTIFTLPEKLVMISEPKGNRNVGGNYGEGIVNVSVDCATQEAIIRDRTPYGYQGMHGLLLASRTISVIAPPDPSGVFPDAQVFQGYSQLAFPLTISGKGYRATIQTPVDYVFDNNITLRLKYIKTQSFDVNCNYDLCPLLYEFEKLLDQAQTACDERLDRKIGTISAMILEAVMIKLQPTCPADLGKLIDEIKEFAGWNCDCNCDGPIGMNGNPYTGGTLNVQFNTGGDLQATATASGNNVLLNLKDLSYLITVGTDTKNRSFAFTPSTSSSNKTYELNVNLDFLAADLISKIGSVPQLLTAFNSLVNNTFQFTVDGKCVINTNPACTYTLFIDYIPTDPAISALFKSITIGDIINPINVNFNSTNGLTAIQAKLNALGKGNFVVSSIPGPGGTSSALQVLTTGNSNIINSATVYGVGAAEDRTMTVTKSGCAASVAYSPSQIVQAMIDYLCKINATQIKLGYDFVFASMDATGKLLNVNFKSTDSLADLIKVLNDNASIAIAIGQAGGQSSISCASLQAILNNRLNVIKPTDTIFGLRDGACGQWSQTDLLRSVISTITNTNDAALKSDWCKAINLCAAATSCNPVTQASLANAPLRKEDFFLVATNLVFSGYYTSQLLASATTVSLQQVDGAGNLGTTGTIVMPVSTNMYNNALGALPALAAGFTWKVTGFSGNTSNYLRFDILNNGAASYKVAGRLVGGPAYTYSLYPAQGGQYTRLLYPSSNANYEGSVIAVCGVNSESVPLPVVSSSSCPAMNTFNVVRSGSNFLIAYAMPAPYTSFRMVIDYGSGGHYDQVQTGSGSTGTITMAIPDASAAEYKFTARVICDLASGWYGPYTGVVTVNVPVVVTNPGLVLFGWTTFGVSTENVDSYGLQHSQILVDPLVESYDIDVSGTDIPAYRNFIIRENAAAPLKRSYRNVLNLESIPDYTFNSPVVKGPYRYYFTNAPRSFDPQGPLTLSTAVL